MTFAPEPTVPADAPPALYWWLVAAAVCLTLVGTLVANELPPFLDRRARAKRRQQRIDLLTNQTGADCPQGGSGSNAEAAYLPRAVKRGQVPTGNRSTQIPAGGNPLARPGKRRASAFFDTDDV